jgi:fructose-1,6-bisphosphatase/inositol monophosphatase family enzyme
LQGGDALALDGDVSGVMCAVGREVVMPRFRTLSPDQISEKAPGDLVTIADRLAEERLREGLSAILPEARVIGEEACAADPRLLDDLDQGLAWIVDPIDGTGNYAAGKPNFAIMVALVENGVTLAGWIHDPLAGRLCHAGLGQGAFLDGGPILAYPTGAEPPRAALGLEYLPEALRTRFAARMAGRLEEIAIPRSAGQQYLQLVTGEADIALFRRMLPWDHAAGALILTEAGGRIASDDGKAYALVGSQPTIAAATPALWTQARAILFG